MTNTLKKILVGTSLLVGAGLGIILAPYINHPSHASTSAVVVDNQTPSSTPDSSPNVVVENPSKDSGSVGVVVSPTSQPTSVSATQPASSSQPTNTTQGGSVPCQ